MHISQSNKQNQYSPYLPAHVHCLFRSPFFDLLWLDLLNYSIPQSTSIFHRSASTCTTPTADTSTPWADIQTPLRRGPLQMPVWTERTPGAKWTPCLCGPWTSRAKPSPWQTRQSPRWHLSTKLDCKLALFILSGCKLALFLQSGCKLALVYTVRL